MAPRVPDTTKDVKPAQASTEKGAAEAQPRSGETGTLSLLRKVALSSPLLSSDGAAVFEQVFMLPVLQALGTPVALVTVSGCISASLAIGAVPLCGWLSDGGSNPRKRKKPAVLGATLLMLMGLGLILTGNALHLWANLPVTSSTRAEVVGAANSTDNVTTTVVSAEYLFGQKNLSDSWENIVGASTAEPDIRSGKLPPGTEPGHSDTALNKAEMTTLSLIISTESEDGIPDSADMDKFFTDPLGIGLPLVALVAMAGFVLLDIGYDLSNASVKTYMLSVSHQADHVSLLVMGVLMSALGGCSTAATGLVDLTPILGVTSTTSAVCGQAVVQLLTIMVLTLLCTFSSLVSAPSDAPNKEDEVKLLPEPTDEGGEVGVVVDMSTATLQTEVQESIIMATTSPVDALGLSVSTQVERNRDFHSLSIRLGHPLHTTPETQVKNRLLNKKVSYNTMQCLEPETQRKTKMRWNLFIICLAAFFTGGSMFLFITCVTDYVGKVLYGGDPEADPESEEYELYGQGLRTGSLGMLILNLAYVAFSLVHRRVLSFLGPKKEYLLVSAFVIGLLLSLQLTDDMAVYYVTSGVMGLNRAVLYTIPFMLANQQCHQDETSQLEHGHGHGRVGSTMALVTCALPCAFLVVCAIAGPLIDATGDPGAPMILSIGFCAVASFTFVFYKP